jgi:hypothetical protein
MLRAKVMVLYMLGDIDLTEGFNLCPANKDLINMCCHDIPVGGVELSQLTCS